METIRRDDGHAGRIVAVVIMDDHVHALLALNGTVPVNRIVQTWKSVSSHAMTREHGRTAPVWQRDYFDRWLQDEVRIRKCTRYIVTNPERRWPGIEGYSWVYSDA